MAKLYLMFFRYISILSFLLVQIHLWGQAPEEKSLLWKISGRTLPADSYLYGTIHLI